MLRILWHHIILYIHVNLLPPEEQDNMDELNDFCEKNEFNGCFKTSAKTGKNISESMEFLITEIIKMLQRC